MIQQQPGHSCLVLVTFHMPKDCLHVFLSSSPLSSSAVNSPSTSGFYFLMLPPHFWSSSLSCPFLSLCPLFRLYSFLTSPPDWPLWPGLFSSIATRVASPSAALEQLQFTHWWWGFQREHLVSHWRKHPGDLVAHGGLVSWSFSMLWYGGLCVTRCLVYSGVLPYYSSSS